MGLNEKRKLKELQDATFPERTKELAGIAGTPIAYDVDWPGFAEDGGALNFLDNVACHRLNMAMRMICGDQTGKDAVKAGLKIVRIKNVKTAAEKKLSFSGGTLEMRGAYAMGLDGAFSDGEIRQILESSL